ncbi:MAG: cation:proton antiporter [Synechococcaceae cyanobacterium]|nr:cation:proton antiporter [Synechococcaceae cyanobacterium]
MPAVKPVIEAANLEATLSLPLIMVIIGGIFLGTLAISRFSLKMGVPAILGVLLFGLAINPRIPMFSQVTVQWLHTLSLAMLLFYAGLRSELRLIRGFLEYGVLLAIGGVAISSLLLSGITWLVATPDASGLMLAPGKVPLSVAMLVAACLGSTDAGATMSVLKRLGDALPARVVGLLEFESSLNDPAAILFMGLVVGLTAGSGHGGAASTALHEAQVFAQKMGAGVLVGLVLGYMACFCLNRLVHEQEQLLILGVAIGLLSCGVADLLKGSGFIAAYITGMFLSNHRYSNQHISPSLLQEALLPFNTMTEICVFLIFGLVVHPTDILPSVPEGLVIAAGMMLIARPLSVLAFQTFSPFTLRESLLISWCGLRGAVPLALTFVVMETIPRLPGISTSMVPLQRNAEGIIFTVVVFNLLVQGLSLPPVCRWLVQKPVAAAATLSCAAGPEEAEDR